MRRNTKTLIAGAGAAGVLGLGLFVAVPAVADPSPAPSTSASPEKGDRNQWKRQPHRWAARGGRGVHGEATVRRDGGFRVVTWQRGEVTGRSGAVVTVRSADGASWQWTTNDKTRFRRDGEKSQLSEVKNGDQVIVVGERTGATRTAVAFRVPKD
ncbi:hypothetical protein Acsp04_64240 [Actinomadura sp. NBRC 104425]|uniref:hypothetical protein n=1 Tax=Actinomadura sp. NBRC 104425 TaxID=3032204 RepID=UPI00249FE17F|nr:hypothetical protein [Actinomadura sp. NBRC 104425]GLZ16189.1 hypothetical protein Acsp04_64240 [Actinomadura sp. NBRC 104425]